MRNRIGSTVQIKEAVGTFEWRMFLVYLACRAFRRVVPKSVRGGLESFFFSVAPEVPVTLRNTFRRARLQRVFLLAFVATFLLGFGVVAVWSTAIGTFRGTDPTRVYFSGDYPNLLNYLIICPMYVALGATLIAVLAKGRSSLLMIIPSGRHAEHRGVRAVAKVALLVLIAGMTVASTSHFAAEFRNPAIYPRVYWFAQLDLPRGTRSFNGLGVYYLLLNAALLAFTLAVVAMTITFFLASIAVGDGLAPLLTKQRVAIAELRQRLMTLTEAYLLAKLLAAAYMANAFTYKWQHPHGSVNLTLMGAAITFFGVFFVSFPRYYIQLQWCSAKVEHGLAVPGDADAADDIRPMYVRNIAGLLDTIIIGSFITTFWL